MIEKLNITEFRGIRKCEKEIELSKFNVLAGRNNSGKTALLEAVYLLGENKHVIQSVDGKIFDVTYFHSGTPNSVVLVDREYIDKNPKEQITEYLKNKVKIEVKISKEINDRALHFSCKYGSREVNIYGCIFGKEKNIEEDIATLILKKYDVNLKPEKEEIRKFLRENRAEEVNT